MRRSAWLLLGSIAGVTLLIGCGEPRAAGELCADESDCGAGLVCAFSRCRVECGDDEDCADGRCVADRAGARGCTLVERDDTCVRRDDCPAPLICFEGECRNGCDPECPPGAACTSPEAGGEVCEWGSAGDAGPPPPDGATDAGPDSGAVDAGGEAPRWPADFPAECIPAPGESIGEPCEEDGDCASGVCDPERSVEIPLQGGSHTVVHSPNGTCVATRVAPGQFFPPFDGRRRCGACGVLARNPALEFACYDRCAQGAPAPRGGCREGFLCDPRWDMCFPGCQSDFECQLRVEGLTWAPQAALAGSTCDLESGRCIDEVGEGRAGEVCANQTECGEGLFCAGAPGPLLPDYTLRGACHEADSDGTDTLIEACPGWSGLCTRACADDADCEDGTRCAEAPHQTMLAGRRALRMCMRTCEVGAEDAEDRVGSDGGGEGCPAGMGCYAPGVCAPANYNDVSEPNLGESCFSGDSCWSPFGLGRCGFHPRLSATCVVEGCDDPVLGPLVCPEEVGACVDGVCMARCGDGVGCDGGAQCLEVDGVQVCESRCRSDLDCGGSRDSCIDVTDYELNSLVRRCSVVSSSGFFGCFPAATIGLDSGVPAANVSSEGWIERTARGQGDSIAPCGGTQVDVVVFQASASGRLEIEATGEGQRVLGLFDRNNCAAAYQPETYDCEADAPFTVRVEAGEFVWLAVTGTQTGETTRETQLRFRLIRDQPAGSPCGGALGCAVGLTCEEFGGVDRCVPARLCGEGVPVVGLLDSIEDEEFFGPTVRVGVGADSLDTLRGSCSGGGEFAHIFRRRAVAAERWILTNQRQGALSVRDDCLDAASERECLAFPQTFPQSPPLVFDLAAGEQVDVLSERFPGGGGAFGEPLEHLFTAVRRPLLSEGADCSGEGAECGVGTLCQSLTSGSQQCTRSDLGCGPGVALQPTGLLSAGVRNVTVPLRYRPAPPPLDDPMDYCDAPAEHAAAILSFQVDAPSTLAMVNIRRPDNRRPPVWSLREACGGESLACGRRLRQELSPLLLPGRIYHLLAWDPEPIEGEVEFRLTIERPALPGQPCGGLACHPSAVCDTGTCRATTCGDGVREGQEQCDDGDRDPGDGCDASCRVEGSCGNARFENGEECDDANVESGDGCSSSCELEVAEIVADDCLTAVTLAGVPAGQIDVLRMRVTAAGASDQLAPASAVCTSPTVPSAPDRVVFVYAEENEAAQLNPLSGSSVTYARPAVFCSTGLPSEDCGTSETGPLGEPNPGFCIGLRFTGVYAVVLEPNTDVFEFDLRRFPTTDCSIIPQPPSFGFPGPFPPRF